jgi:hypothetical protein
MGDTFKREFSIGQVDTGTPYEPGKTLTPGNTIHFGLDQNQTPDIHVTGASGMPYNLPGAPTSVQTIARPSFLSAFLQNLGPALAGSLQAPKGSGVAGGLAGGFSNISAEQHRRLQEAFEQQQLDTTKQATDARAQLEKMQAEQMGSQVTLPNGMTVPFALAQKLFPTLLKAQSTEGIASANRDSRESIAAENRDSRETVAANNLTAKPPAKPNELQLIQKANAGDKEAASTLKTLQSRRMEIAQARGGGQYSNFFNPELGRNERLSNEDAKQQQQSGKVLIPAGPVSATQILQTQRAQTAIPAAVSEVRKHLSAWDNPQDKAIFARIISESPSGGVDHATWFGTVLNNKLTNELSPEGKAAVLSLRRLNESLGSLRVAAALPATTGSMATTAALAPGATSPDSKFAGQQLDQILQLVEQETGVPFLGLNKKGGSSPSNGKRRTIDLTQ